MRVWMIFGALGLLFGVNEQVAAQPARQATNLTNNLCGTYGFSATKGAESSLYDAFVFLGNGKVIVSAMGILAEYDFFQAGDTLYAFPDKDIFIFKVQDKNSLSGLSEWVNKGQYEKLRPDTVVCKSSRTDMLYLTNFHHYTRAIVKGVRLSNYLTKPIDPKFVTLMERLCSEKFSKACLVMANIALSNSASSSLFSVSKQKADEKVLSYFQKAIDLKDANGHAKMGEYYLLLNDLPNAKVYLKKACDLGERNSCMTLMERGLDN